MGFATWLTMGMAVMSLGAGGVTTNSIAGPLTEAVVEVVDETGGGAVDVVESATQELIEPIVEEVVAPIIDETIEPIGEELAETVEEVAPQPDFDPGVSEPKAGADSSPTSEPSESGTTVEGGSEPSNEISNAVTTALEASEQQSGGAASPGGIPAVVVDQDSQDRLAALLRSDDASALTSRFAIQQLDGVLAWLTDGPGILRLLAAPLGLLTVMVRALASAGSGLVAPLSLLAALVVRQLRRDRNTAAAS